MISHLPNHLIACVLIFSIDPSVCVCVCVCVGAEPDLQVHAAEGGGADLPCVKRGGDRGAVTRQR